MSILKAMHTWDSTVLRRLMHAPKRLVSRQMRTMAYGILINRRHARG